MTDTATIRFDTSVDDGREESGVLDDNVLRTPEESRPDFRLEGDGSVTLLAAKSNIVFRGFGENVAVIRQQTVPEASTLRVSERRGATDSP